MKTNIEALQPDTVYHIYNRGVNSENLFKEERNYSYFLNKYDRFVSPVADTYAYCLLKNHFHILIRTKGEKEILEFEKMKREASPTEGFLGKASLLAKPSLNPSKIISNAFASLFKSYAQSINKAHRRTGTLFEEPFRRIAVNSDGYFSRMIFYIHFNPQKHGFISDFRKYPHSSYSSFFMSQESSLINKELVLEWFGDVVKFKEFHNLQSGPEDLKDLEWD